jgi:hypothetical protein
MDRPLKTKKGRSSARARVIQTPRLPFAVLFRIIDDRWATARTPREGTAILANIGRTCRELAIHCRALLFRFVQVQLDFNRSYDYWRISSAIKFAGLAQRYPSSIALVQHLSLYIHHKSQSKKEQLHERGRQWLGIINAAYLNLKF